MAYITCCCFGFYNFSLILGLINVVMNFFYMNMPLSDGTCFSKLPVCFTTIVLGFCTSSDPFSTLGYSLLFIQVRH